MENTNNLQANKRSMSAIVVGIIALSFTFLCGIYSHAQYGTTFSSFKEIFLFLLKLSPMVILVVYMLGFQNEQRVTILVPIVFILITFYLFIYIVESFTYFELLKMYTSGIIRLVVTFVCYIPMIVFSSVLIASSCKGFKKKGVVVAYVVFSFIESAFVLLNHFLMYDAVNGRTDDLLTILLVVSVVLTAISILLFAVKGNVPSIVKVKTPVTCQCVSDQSCETSNLEFCPSCGEKYVDGAMFCAKCGRKR